MSDVDENALHDLSIYIIYIYYLIYAPRLSSTDPKEALTTRHEHR